MSVQISGVLKDGAGKPVGGCAIELRAKKTSPTVVVEVISSSVTDANGHYSIEAEPGYYSVSLLREGFPPARAGDIYVTPTDAPDTLNAFLDAPKDGDLRPEVMKRFEEMVNAVIRLSEQVTQDKEATEAASESAKNSAIAASASEEESRKHKEQSQKNAETAASSAQEAGKHAADAELAKKRVETLTDDVRQNANAVADSKQRVELLASEVAGHAGQVQQGVQDAEEAVKMAQQAAKKSASSATESKSSAESSAQYEQNAQQHAQNAEQNAQQTSTDRKATTTARDDAERFAAESRQNAEATAQDRIATAENTKQSQLNAQTSEQSAQEAKSYRDSAQQIVDGLNATNATTTQKGLVQLSSAMDSDSEELAATPKAVKTVMDEVQTRAPLDSPALTGGPTAPTPDLNAKGREIANAAFVRALIAALVGSVPETLDTLNELAAALGNDPNFATTVTDALAGKQPLNTVLTAVSNLTQRADNLLYFNADEDISLAPLSEKARSLLAQATQEEMRTVLELKGAATMEPQGDIYDRTEGRLAVPGMYGYGSLLSSRDRKEFTNEDEFLTWVRGAMPGRYPVYADTGVVIPGVLLSGMVEVIWPDTAPSDYEPVNTTKVIFFYGVGGEMYYNRYRNTGNGFLIGWENLKLGEKGVADILRSGGGVANGYTYPDIGGLVFAAYCGSSDDDASRKIYRGASVAGSRLAPVSIISAAGSSDRAQAVMPPLNLFPMAGTFVALSGSPSSSGSGGSAITGLFVRVA